MGKSTISMTMFNSYVELPEGKTGLGKRSNLSQTLGTIGNIISNKYLKTQNLHGTFTKPCKSGDFVPNKNKLRVFSFQNKWRNISELSWKLWVFTTKNGEESRIELKKAGAKKNKRWGGNRCTQTTWFMIGKYRYPNL